MPALMHMGLSHFDENAAAFFIVCVRYRVRHRETSSVTHSSACLLWKNIAMPAPQMHV